MAAAIEDLKSAGELIEKAAELLREAAAVTSLPSEAARRSVHDEVARIRLKLMLIRHDLATLHATANRRKLRPTPSAGLLQS